MRINIETPPALTGDADKQLSQLRSYLFRLSEQLGASLSDAGTSSGGAQLALNVPAPGYASSGGDPALTDSEIDAVRALLLRTAGEPVFTCWRAEEHGGRLTVSWMGG